jgi:hypothetical protein
LRHGLICDVVADHSVVLSSDESFKVREHSGYSEMGTCGYETQFLERYDSRAGEVDFEKVDFDDSEWSFAEECHFDDHTMAKQNSRMLEFERISPEKTSVNGNRIFYDFGANYVGYLSV